MSCSCCTKKFGFLEKELGCPECGFSFCKKCLKYEAKDPNKEDATRKICSKCHVKHVQMEPPLDTLDEYSQKFRRCIETMCESDEKVKINFKNPKERFGSVREGFDHETQQLQARLQALEEDYKKSQPKLKTEEELSEWLDKIQDKPSSSKRPSDAYRPPDRRTETECTDQLLQQFMEEAAIDKQAPKPELELEERLARLRGEGTSKAYKLEADELTGRKNVQQSLEMESPSSSKKPTKGIWGLDLPSSADSEDNDELAAQAIVKKALLDAEMEKSNVDEDEDLEDDLVSIFSHGNTDIEVNISVYIDDEHVETEEAMWKQAPQHASQPCGKKRKMAAKYPSSKSKWFFWAEFKESRKELYALQEKQLEITKEPKKYPWCVVCNENAAVKCLDCDGDLYCDACFTECCKPEEHLSEPYVNESQGTQ